MSTRDRNRTTASETGEEAPLDLATGADTPEGTMAPETPAPAVEAPLAENPDAEHVPVEYGKGGCYVIGDDGRRVRVPT